MLGNIYSNDAWNTGAVTTAAEKVVVVSEVENVRFTGDETRLCFYVLLHL